MANKETRKAEAKKAQDNRRALYRAAQNVKLTPRKDGTVPGVPKPPNAPK